LISKTIVGVKKEARFGGLHVGQFKEKKTTPKEAIWFVEDGQLIFEKPPPNRHNSSS